MNGILFIILIIVFLAIHIYGLLKFNKNKYCNSNYNLANEYNELRIDEPEYKVHTIREVCPKNKGPLMAEYTLWNFYLDKKDSVESQELIIFDEIGKYRIGDKLKFTKV